MTELISSPRRLNLTCNADLIWKLEGLTSLSLAERFMRLFESRLGVYSESVRALYTNYSLFFPVQLDRSMVILPDPYAHHDTLHHVDSRAVKPTGICIHPGFHRGQPTLLLLRPASPLFPCPVSMPLKPALARMILHERCHPGSFLPVLVKGDLRRFDRQTPCLHLHRLHPQSLHRLSEFERRNIRQALLRKLMQLYKDADKLLLA